MLRDTRHSLWHDFGPAVMLAGLLFVDAALMVWVVWFMLQATTVVGVLLPYAVVVFNLYQMVATTRREVQRLMRVLGFRDLTPAETRELRQLLGLPPDPPEND